MLDYNELRKRLYNTILKQFEGDKRKALTYIREKCTFYARKADSKYGSPHYEQWRTVYKAYSDVQFQMGYWLEQDERIDDDWDDMWEVGFQHQQDY